MDRLRQYQRGTLQYNETTGVVSVQAPITLSATDQDRTYALDGLGNWRRTDYTRVLTPTTTEGHQEVRQHNYLNQVTHFDGTAVAYDHGNNTGDESHRGNGNLVDDGTRVFAYDALNRLKEVMKKDGGARVASYTYDALGRRVRKEVTNGGIPNEPALDGTTDYLYTGVQCVEERNPFGGAQQDVDTSVRQYVWGLYVDELIQQKEKGTPDTDYYLLSDLLYRSVALTDTTPAIQEAYDTDAYGNTLVFSDPDPADGWFGDDDVPIGDPSASRHYPLCRFGFTGRSYDVETGIYFYRARYYHQELGRFLARDPIGYIGGMNVFEYVLGAPAVFCDAGGLTVRASVNATVTAFKGYQERFYAPNEPADYRTKQYSPNVSTQSGFSPRHHRLLNMGPRMKEFGGELALEGQEVRRGSYLVFDPVPQPGPGDINSPGSDRFGPWVFHGWIHEADRLGDPGVVVTRAPVAGRCCEVWGYAYGFKPELGWTLSILPHLSIGPLNVGPGGASLSPPLGPGVSVRWTYEGISEEEEDQRMDPAQGDFLLAVAIAANGSRWVKAGPFLGYTNRAQWERVYEKTEHVISTLVSSLEYYRADISASPGGDVSMLSSGYFQAAD